MSNIEQNLAFILSSRYGEDVRKAIHDAIHDCYEDGKAGAIDLVAREQIANLVANEGSTEKDSELVDVRVGANGNIYESAGEAVRNQIKEANDSIKQIDSIIFNDVIESGKLTFLLGGVYKADGTTGAMPNRVRNLIAYAKKGSSISIANGFLFSVARYSEGSTGSFIDYYGFTKDPYYFQSDTYFIVTIRDDAETVWTEETMATAVDALTIHMVDDTQIEDMKQTINTMKEEILQDWNFGIVPIELNIGEVLPMLLKENGAWMFQVVSCKAGDKFYYNGYGGYSSKAWAFCDKQFKLLSVTEQINMFQSVNLTAPEDGYLICNAAVNQMYELRKLKEILISNQKNKFNNIFSPKMEEYRISVSNLTYNDNTTMSYEEIMNGYDSLVSKYPEYIEKKYLGYDTSGTIQMYRYDFIPPLPTMSGTVNVLAHTYDKENFPTVIMDACIHGAERPCAKALLNLMTLISDAKSNDIFGWLRENIHFVIIPILNVWGYKNSNRNNVNSVDLNRNFPIYWEFGEDSTENDRYRGTSALSEKETQYIHAILQEYRNKALCYYSWHTHGLFTGWNVITCFAMPTTGFFDEMQNVGIDVIKSITNSGWKNHELPTNSGLIGFLQVSGKCGMSSFDGVANGIPSACPEVMYRYYDGGTGEVYNENTDAMNVEYMLYSICSAIKTFRN